MVRLKRYPPFFGLLHKFDLTRTQALRLATDTYHAQKVANNKVAKLLKKATPLDFPIMVFVENRGKIQIHTGEMKRFL